MQNAAYERRRLRLIAAYARKGEVLDLGCAQKPNPFFKPPCQVTGYDLTPLPTPPAGYARFLCGDVQALPTVLAPRRFDYVIAGELIEHLEQPYQFLRDVRQVFQPGGRLILSTTNPLGFPMSLAELSGGRRFYSEEHLYGFTPRWMKRLLERCGYRLEAIRGVGLWLPVGWIPCPASLSYQVIYVAAAI